MPSLKKSVIMNTELRDILVSIINKTHKYFSRYSVDELSKIQYPRVLEFNEALLNACADIINDICHQSSEIRKEAFGGNYGLFDEPSVTITYDLHEQRFRSDALSICDNQGNAASLLEKVNHFMSRYPEYFA